MYGTQLSVIWIKQLGHNKVNMAHNRTENS